MFDGWLPEIGDLAALDDAAIVDAAGGWARVEAAACARKQAAIAETFAGVPDSPPTSASCGGSIRKLSRYTWSLSGQTPFAQ